MKCSEISALLQDYHDGHLHGRRRDDVQNHVQACARCRQELVGWQLLTARLAGLEKAKAPAALVGRIQRSRRRRFRGAVTSGMAALAAGIVAWVISATVFMPGKPASETEILAHVDQARQVRFLVNAEHSLDKVQFSLDLPKHVSLRGFGDRRQLSWYGHLRKGDNLLKLPVVARHANSGILVLRIKHGQAMREYKVTIHAQS